MVRPNKKKIPHSSATTDSEESSTNDDTCAHTTESENTTLSMSSSEETASTDGEEDSDESSSDEDTETSGTNSPDESFEEEFAKEIENASAKSAQTRVAGLKRICDTLIYYFVPDAVQEWKMTLIDCAEKSLRHGNRSEQIFSARLAPLLALQLNGEDTVLNALSPIIWTGVKDKSVSLATRAEYCSALGLLYYLSAADNEEFLNLMKLYETIFTDSYLSGENKKPNAVSAEAGDLHAAALLSWALIFSLLPSRFILLWMTDGRLLFPSLDNLKGLLKSPHLKVRIAAGQALVIIVECGRLNEKTFLLEYLADLIDDFKKLAKDSHKHHSKRKRKTQHLAFRNMLLYLEEDVTPKVDIRFGNETLVLDTWRAHHLYAVVCGLMGGGMNTHLSSNNFFRSVFLIGDKVTDTAELVKQKHSKFNRNRKNIATSKARTKARRESRDKRTADFTEV
ncbi:interferon-related developmental regulator 2-like [Teleopsis dalmanni]|uniref:interferon-related developmental regulator 2-like n=1 Tax=Teleopsis dalmanni TaxID=139649 RepID=UPI0018CE2F33|nr:interferon-related developmental regulator 2-like [Teleopsis dalmanni]